MACEQQIGSESDQSLVAVGATLVRVGSGFSFTEGPAADSTGNVYFTDQPNNKILKWSTEGTVSVFMENAGRANGLYFDDFGNLIACADEDNQLWRISTEMEVEILVADINGKKLNGPNDVWVSADSGIFFTDPYYQRDYWVRSEPEMESENVYNRSPNGIVSVVDYDLVKPNGIVGSVDGSRLYVADIGANKTYVYTKGSDGRYRNKREFVPMGSDGMTIDTQGNVYLTGDGISIFNVAGEKIQHISVDAPWTSNVTFGGSDRNMLFITASDSVFTIKMNVQGVRQ
jgi:gluconolactonase